MREIAAAAESNYGERRNTPIDTLVIHTTESTLGSAVAWFRNRAAKASAHYVIDADHVVECVPEGYCAWHAGNAAVNRRSVGIEVAGHAGSRETWTPEVMAQLVTLAAEIVRRHNIPIVRQAGPGICGHMDVPDPSHPDRRGGAGHHVDPGPYFPWEPFLDALRRELSEVA